MDDVELEPVEAGAMEQEHGVPALLSFFFPGLGQLVKRQYERVVLIWLLLLLPWLLWLLRATVLTRALGYELDWVSLSVFGAPFVPFALLLNLVVHLWGVVDAYTRPI